jgi:phosphomannomutase
MLFLFDVDGTLTVPRNKMSAETKQFFLAAKEKIRDSHIPVQFGIVSGSDLPKLQEQIGDDLFDLFDLVFSENGLVAYGAGGRQFHSNSFYDFIGAQAYQRLVNSCMRVMSIIELPVKRGTFLELRTGMLNVCPVGRSCTQKERDEFEHYDRVHGVRKSIIEQVMQECGEELGIQMSIGGQISIDVFPQGWNKTYCLEHIDPKQHSTIYFFGDRIFPGGNDYEIAQHPRVKSHSVSSPEETIRIVKGLLECLF